MIERLKFWIADVQGLLEEFLMMFDEKVLRRCGVCGLKKAHKMDCHREYIKVNRRG